MLKNLKLLCMILVFGCSFAAHQSVAQALDKFSCTADQATGFKWDGNKWIATTFPVAPDKLVIEETAPTKSAIDDRIINYVVTKPGRSGPAYYCSRHDIKDQRGTRITCGGLGFGFALDFKAMRYQEYHGLGYFDGQDRPEAATQIIIGRCTRI